MIAEDVQRKLWIGGLVGGVILGGLFLIWAVFLNRGTIIIHSKAPFAFTIEGLRTENCASDTCTTVVAPGDYTVTVQKTGYKSESKKITVPLGSPYEDNISLEFIPTISPGAQTKDQIFPSDPALTKDQLNHLGIGSQIQLFYNDQKNVFCYIVRNPDNFRQTLFMATIDPSGQISTPEVVTSFLRDIQSYVVVPADDGNKIAVIDRATDGATLYVVDRQAKNRISLLTYPMIRDMRWIQGTNDFLFQAREQTDGPESVYLYRSNDGKATQLSLRTPLSDVAIVDDTRILAVTDQALPTGTSVDALQGQLVPLGENQSTAEVNAAIALSDQTVSDASAVAAEITPAPASTSTTTVTPEYSFIDYSLLQNEARLITVLTTDPFPARVKLSGDAKSLDFLQGDKVFELRFEE